MNTRLIEVLNTWSESEMDFDRLVIHSIIIGDTGYFQQLCAVKNNSQIIPSHSLGLPNGCTISQIGESNKVKVQPVVDKPDWLSGDTKDIPIKWFSKYHFQAINNNIQFVAYNVSEESWYTTNITQDQILIKMLVMCKTSESREFWMSRLETLILYPHYNITCVVGNGKSGEISILPDSYFYDIKEEHAQKGFFKISEKYSSVFTKYVGKYVFSCEEMKKAIARNSRLVETPEATYIGTHQVYVIDDVPESLKEWFVSGSGFTPNSIMEKLGGMRITSAHGCKFTTSPMPMNVEFPENMPEGIVLSKQSFKGNLNGIYLAQNPLHTVDNLIKPVATKNDVDYISSEEVISSLVSTEMEFLGKTIKVYPINVDLYASDFYVLWGLRLINEDDVEDNKKSSYYLWAKDAISILAHSQHTFDLIGDIQSRIKGKDNPNGDLKYLTRSIKVKTQEFTVARFSYGYDVATSFIHSVLTNSNISGSTSEALDLQTNASEMKYETYTQQQIFNTMINGIFAGEKINPGRFDPEDMKCSEIEYDKRLDWLLYGGNGWSGLLSLAPKKITINSKNYYIPSGYTMKQYIHPEEGSKRVFFSGPAAGFMKLIISIKIVRNTDWNVKYINHYIELQKYMLGENIDGFSVHGDHFAMLPAPWLESHEISFASNVLDFKKHCKQVTFSKMPVLFNCAINDVVAYRHVNTAVFGKLSIKMKMALRNMMFMNVKQLLDHQNDTDGDLGRVMDVGGHLPLYSGVPEHMKQWCDKYASDEYDMKMTYKSYKVYLRSMITPNGKSVTDVPVEVLTRGTMSDAVFESVENKMYLGIATNALFFISHVLQLQVHKGIISEQDAIIIRDGYAMAMQDAVVRGIKHEGASETFKTAKLYNMFYTDQMEDMLDARMALRAVVFDKTGLDMYESITKMFNGWDTYADVEGSDISPLAARRTSSIEGISLEMVKNESDIIILDSITRSFLRNTESAMPTFKHGKSFNSVASQKYALICSNLDAYLAKYCILGQDMTNAGEGSVLNVMFNTWKGISEFKYHINELTKSSEFGDTSDILSMIVK